MELLIAALVPAFALVVVALILPRILLGPRHPTDDKGGHSPHRG